MTVLVTGGAGYIGSHMVHALVDAGERVVVLDNLTTGFDLAVATGASLVVGDAGDQSCVAALIAEHGIDAVIHFAASIVVPDSVRDPLGYYRNNTVNSRALIETAVKEGVRHFIFSSTAAVYGNPASVPVREDDPTVPTSPYGSSKLMTETMLRDAGAAHGLSYVILRYFNVAGADPLGRTGQSTAGATHLIKVAAETALGLRPKMQVFGTNYSTPDGTCIRDYIHVADLVAAHSEALAYLRGGGPVLEVIKTVKRVSGVDFKVELAPRRPGLYPHPPHQRLSPGQPNLHVADTIAAFIGCLLASIPPLMADLTLAAFHRNNVNSGRHGPSQQDPMDEQNDLGCIDIDMRGLFASRWR